MSRRLLVYRRSVYVCFFDKSGCLLGLKTGAPVIIAGTGRDLLYEGTE